MRLWEYAVRRLLLMVLVIVGVTLITFYLSRGIPGIDPVAAYVSEKSTPEQIEYTRRSLGLDQPLPVQYFFYLRDLFSGEWGYSRSLTQPVLEGLTSRFPATFELSVIAIVLVIVIGIPLGIVSALRNNKWPDHGTRLFALVGVSIPIFWLGLLLQLTFFYYFKVWGLPHLPSANRLDPVLSVHYPVQSITGLVALDTILTGNITMFGDSILHLVLPAVALSYFNLGTLTRIMRSSMLEVLRQDYILMARSKGLSERIVIYRHALKNALIPATTISGLLFGTLLGGAVLTETIFTWPGMGRLAATAIFRNDTPLLLGFVLITAIIVVLTNLAVDLLYSKLDPRIRY